MSNQTSSGFQLASVSVDDEKWTEVSDLSNSGPQERVYVVVKDDAGGSWVRFGDGKRGRRPSPNSRIVTTYRTESRVVEISLERSSISPTPDQELWVFIENRTGSTSFGHYEKAPVAPSEQPLTDRRRIFVCAILIVALLVTFLLTLFLQQ